MVAFFGKRKGYFFLSASKRTFLWQLVLHSKWENMLARLPQPALRATNLYREIAHSTLFEWWIFVEIGAAVRFEMWNAYPISFNSPT